MRRCIHRQIVSWALVPFVAYAWIAPPNIALGSRQLKNLDPSHHSFGVDLQTPAHPTSRCEHSRTKLASSQTSAPIEGSSNAVELPLPNSVLDDDLRECIDSLVEERGKARWDGDYDKADQLRINLEKEVQLPHPDMQLVLEDIPRRLGGGSTWKLHLRLQHGASIKSVAPSDENTAAKVKWLRGRSSKSVLNLAHATLGMAAFASEHQKGYLSPSDKKIKQSIVSQAKQQLQDWHKIHEILSNNQSNLLELLNQSGSQEAPSLTENWIAVESRLDGRKAADAAFWFALSGVQDDIIYDVLTTVVCKELERFGERPSCRAKDVMAVVDRLAAASVRDNPKVEEIVNRILESKEAQDKKEADCRLRLHSDSCALMIWKFSTKQRKQRNFLETAADHWNSTKSESHDDLSITRHDSIKKRYDWKHIFEDPSRPLVVDVGCGMGVSLLGLATTGDKAIDAGLEEDWGKFNFIGNDLGSLAIGYGNNVAKRWGLTNKLHFAVEDSTKLLEVVSETYPGPVAYILVQFPTPYRLSDSTTKSSGNLQLPSSALEGFMVSPDFLQAAGDVLNKPGNSGRLLLQSNCEDVALYMRDCALELGCFRVYEPENTQTSMTIPPPTQRTLSWVERGGARAFGKGWWSEAVLPRQGRTETEVACMVNNKPVHRCVLLLKDES